MLPPTLDPEVRAGRREGNDVLTLGYRISDPTSCDKAAVDSR